jgi:hypothetical protein
MLWYDTSVNPPVLKIFDGASWRTLTVGSTDLVAHAATHARGSTDVLYARDMPVDPVAGSAAMSVQEALGDTVDGFHAASEVIPNRIPVRDSSGKVPGSITGDADTVDGYHASAFALAGHSHVLKDIGVASGTVTGGGYIPVPPGFSASECNTMTALADWGSHSPSNIGYSEWGGAWFTVDANRRVTTYINDEYDGYNVVRNNQYVVVNYIVVGVRR